MAENVPDRPLEVLPRSIVEEDRSTEQSREAAAVEETFRQTTASECSSPLVAPMNDGRRKDKGHLHATRHAALSRYPLEALRHLGENPKTLRRQERRLRAKLKPPGVIGAIVFDRFWSSYLRCLLAARSELSALAPADIPTGQKSAGPSLREREVPTLVLPEAQDQRMTYEALPPDLFRQLALVQRYDRHFSREMYRALAMLLVLRSSGEAGLEQCIRHLLGVKKENSEG